MNNQLAQHKRAMSLFMALLMTLTLLSLIATRTNAIYAVSSAPNLNVSGPMTYIAAGDPILVAPGLTLTGDDIDSVQVSISFNFISGDCLGIQPAGNATSGSITGINWTYNSTTGILDLQNTATTATYQSVLRQVTYYNTSGTSSPTTRTIGFAIGSNLYCAATGHYYEYVASAGISWNAAKTAADGLSYWGLQGYLATVSSAAENTFITSKLPGDAWMGASDSVNKFDWYWVTGPEGAANGGSGTKFFQQTGCDSLSVDLNTVYSGHVGGGGNAINGLYNNWASIPSSPSNQPDDSSIGEYYAHFYKSDAGHPEGTWNDYPNSNTWSLVQGYVVEFGGMAGDPTPQLTGNVTVNVIPAAPIVTGISPTSGTTAGGTIVVISGTNLLAATDVKFGNSSAASFVVNSATQITATSPAVSAGTVDVTVITAGGTSATGATDHFTYVAAPTVTGISPISGTTAGGTSVVITGTNFTGASGASAVKFGATNATSYTVNSDTQITAVSPAVSASTVDVRVTTAGGTSTTSASDQFTFPGNIFSGGYAAENWVLTTPVYQVGDTVSVAPLSGAATSVTFSYNFRNPISSPPPWYTWNFSNTASTTETMPFDWSYSASHAWYEAKARLYVFANGPGGNTQIPLYDGVGTSTTTTTGSSSIAITSGYSWGFTVQGSNYDSSNFLNGTLTIGVKTLTITGITASSKEYDGNTNAPLNISGPALEGVIAGQDVSLNISSVTGAFADKNVANGKTVNISGLSLTGADAAKYRLGSLTANITAKALTVTATGPSKTYGTALTATTSTTNFSFSGTIAGETVTGVTLTPNAAGLAATTAAGAAYVVTPSLATGSGGFIESNYQVTYTAYNGTVAKKALTVTATGPSKIYGTALTAGTSTTNFSFSGTIAGEAVTGVTLTPNAAGLSAATAAGVAYVVTPSLATGSGGFSESNYQVTYNAYNGTVAKKALTVTAVTATKTYDRTTASSGVPTISSGSLVGSDSVTWTQTFDTKNVGTGKTLTPAGTINDGNGGNNYAVTNTSVATGAITAKALTVTGITASNRYYDGTTSATLYTGSAALAGVIAGDVGVIAGDVVVLNTSAAIGTFSAPNPGYRTVTIAGLSISGADALNYSLTQPTTGTSIIEIPPEPPAPIVTPTPSPTPTPIKLHVNIGEQTTTATIDKTGRVQGDATVTSQDRIISLTIPGGTTVLTGNTPTLQITIGPDNTPPAPPVGKNTIGVAYECLPDGTTFSPPISLVWNYNPATLPAGTDETKLQVAFYNEGTQQWETVPGIVDTINHTVTAAISHFSLYEVVAPVTDKPAAASPTPTPSPAQTPLPSPAQTSNPAPTPAQPTPNPTQLATSIPVQTPNPTQPAVPTAATVQTPNPTQAPMPTPAQNIVQSLQPGVVSGVLDSVDTSTTVGGQPVSAEVAETRSNVRKITMVGSVFSGGTLPWYVTQSIDPRTLAGALVSGGAFLPAILGRLRRRK